MFSPCNSVENINYWNTEFNGDTHGIPLRKANAIVAFFDSLILRYTSPTDLIITQLNPNTTQKTFTGNISSRHDPLRGHKGKCSYQPKMNWSKAKKWLFHFVETHKNKKC